MNQTSTDKVVIYYKNGNTDKYEGYCIDGWVDWDESSLTILSTNPDRSPLSDLLTELKVSINTENVLYVVDYHCEGLSLWKNPNNPKNYMVKEVVDE